MSVCGKVVPHTPLAVDFWYVRKCPGTRLFFLSHMHSDHTAGLTSTWSNRPIYCSPVTATLLKLKLRVKEKWIHPLELDDPHLLPLDDIGKEKLTVTLIDANHCPGAVMFLFEGYFGSVLYTGDFRYTPSMLREPCFRTNATIDVLYLDDTNCDPNRTLPTRQRATQQIKEIIRRHPNHIVVIGLYTLGKESLLVELAMEFKTWVEVSVERMETLKALELPDVFTTEPGVGRIRVVRQSEICSATLRQWNKDEPTLAIFPTSRPLVSFHPNVYVVPYSDHSSYQELEDFVSALKPSSLIPLLGDCLPGGLAALLPNKKRHEVLVPESVRNFMLREPERQLCSSTFANLQRRHVHALAPKGVIFDSPVKDSTTSSQQDEWEAECLDEDAAEEEMDAESSGRDSDCILVDLSRKVTPNRLRREATWELDDMQTAPEESLPLRRFSHSSLSPTETLPDQACLRPAGTTLRFSYTPGKKSNSSCDGRRSSQSNHTSSDGDSVSQQSSIDLNDADIDSCTSSGSFNVLQHDHLEELEVSLLKNLLFSEEDMNPRGLLPKNLVQQFSLVP